MSYKILLADDHPMVLEGLQRILENDGGFEIVGLAQSGEVVLPLIRKTSPEIVFLDMHMPKMNGLECTVRIRSDYPDVGVVICTSDPAPEQAQLAFQAGACGYVVKTIDPRDVGPAIRQAVEGTAFHAAGLPALAEVPVGIESGLTPREVDVMKGVARGLTNKAIGKELWISESTVKFHTMNAYRKLSLSNRTEAAGWAFSKGLHEKQSLPALSLVAVGG